MNKDNDEEEIDQEDQNLTEDMINKLLEEAEDHDNRMTKDSLVICINNLESKYTKNKELRKKHKTQPELYADSEADLHEEIKVLQRIAAYPDLISIFIDNKGIDLLITLLHHENYDIISDAIIVIDEITDADFLQDIELPKEFLELFISNNIFELLTNILRKLNEKNNDELQLISDILSVFENFIEVYPFSSQIICDNTNLLEWLIKRLSIRDNLNIRLFASEIIDSLILNSDNQIIFNKKDGLQVSMNVLLDFKIPQNEVEEEFIYNIMNIICNTLLMTENQDLFRESYGIKHMINLMRENNIYRHIAIKILNYATLNNETNCTELIENDGLKSVFSYFMGKGLKGRKNKQTIDSFEEHVLSLIVSLCKYSKYVNHDRLIYKFKETNYEKCERIVEFYKKYEKNENNDESNIFIIQNISIIIAFISKYPDIKLKFIKIFPLNNISFENIKSILEELKINLGEDFVSTETFSNKRFIDNIIKNIYN